MANPEIELPMTPSQPQLRTNQSAPGISSFPANPETSRQNSTNPTTRSSVNLSLNNFKEKSDDEKTPDNDDEEHGVGEIIYYYLTEATVLPNPTSILPSRTGQAAPPEPPDISQYASPFEWPESRKRLIIWISCIITCLTAFTAGAYSPGVAQMTAEWHVSNVAALVGITMFTVGKLKYEAIIIRMGEGGWPC